MKNLIKIAFSILIFFHISFLKAQDFIYKTDGTKIECTVDGINSSSITYSTPKSGKSQTLNVNQSAIIIFGNGQFLTLPTSELKFENAKNAQALGNDIIIDKFAEIRIGVIRNLSKSEIEFNDAQSNDLLKINGDEAVLAIYNSGDHVFFRNASEVKALLEYVQPKVYALAEKQSATPTAAGKPSGRPAYISDSSESTAAKTVPAENKNPVEAEPVKIVEQTQPSANTARMSSNLGMSQNVNSNSNQNESTVSRSSSSQVASNRPNENSISKSTSSKGPGGKSNIISSNKLESNTTSRSNIILANKSDEAPVRKAASTEVPNNKSSQLESNSNLKTTVRNDQNSEVYADTTSILEVPTDSVNSGSSNSPDELNDIDFEEFSDKALQKIDDFTNYLGIIASKETVPESANQAIELAFELFVDENVIVEVTTSGYAEVMKRKIRDYLVRLKLLKYDRVEIKWADINYVSNFRKAPDGNYYGSITVKQTFRGYKDNQVVYSDVTQKDVEIVIKGMEKSIQGKKEMVWDVLLSDIGVVDTK